MLLFTKRKMSHHSSPFNPHDDLTLLQELVIYSYVPFLTLYQVFIHVMIFCPLLGSLKVFGKKVCQNPLES